MSGVSMHRDELAAWLRLLETPGVGRESARRLLAAFGSPENALTASTAGLREVVGPAVTAALSKPADLLEPLIESTVQWLVQSTEETPRHIVALGDADFPAELIQTADPPLLLYAQGDISLLHKPSVAVVGSRNPTPQGLGNANAFSAHLSQAGITVISGLALGVDGAAHEGALTGHGSTVAIIGTGLDRAYPRRHLDLARRISKHGLIVSEYSLGTPPMPANFPLRNRIIAGLSRGTLVVEAALQSGSLITARLASEFGREVFAIPGSIHSPQSRGCHSLIKQGAKLVESAQDLLDELHFAKPQVAPIVQAEQASNEDPLLEALGFDPVNLDALVARTGWPAAELSARLLELELEGLVGRLPGQLFQRIVSA